MATVEDLAVEREIDAVKGNAQLHGWLFERIEPRCFRVTFTTNNSDVYQVEVKCDGFPVKPAAFHWRNPETGQLDALADSPAPYGYFHGTGRICAPWNRLASTEGGPHSEWAQSNWMQQQETGGTVTLAAMVTRLHHELRSREYWGPRQ